jgi:hypothetical protein
VIIVTGLGRCGTSFLMKYLRAMGFGLGNAINWSEPMRAGLELSSSFSINREMYIHYIHAGKPIDLDYTYRHTYWDCSYREAIQQVDTDPRQVPVDVIKDPRFTWHPDILKAWWESRQDFKLIICHRKIEDIYKSRKAMKPHQDDPKRDELHEYKEDFADFITTVLELKIPHEFIFFPDFLYEFEKVWGVLDRMGLKHNFFKGKAIWESLIDYPPRKESE